MEFNKKKKTLTRFTIIILILFFVGIYLIGWFFIGGKHKTISLNNHQKETLIELYDLKNISCNDIISFEQISYNRKYANILKIKNTKSNEKILTANPHIEKMKKLRIFGFPYPNSKFIPYEAEECCCFYDKHYYYLSVFNKGSEFNKKINVFFWENYKD